jgi:hypothetical protein
VRVEEGGALRDAPYLRAVAASFLSSDVRHLAHESGKVSIRVLADWLGHAEIDTTLGYLAVSNRRSEAVRSAVNSSFLSLMS